MVPCRDHGALTGTMAPLSGTMAPWGDQGAPQGLGRPRWAPGRRSRTTYDHEKVKHAKNQKSNIQSTHLVQWLVVDHGLAQDLDPHGMLRSS
ncbi:hypothetical protein SUGI_0981640 [Cryptomeria japonica]|nr:hypothetical protein SUGI_0981640 [Cryptomeria japonica]